MDQSTFFKDLKVIELASVLAGPAVGMFFAELGAQVIKVENKKTGGDVTRNWRLPTESKDTPFAAYYACVNWGKENLFLDLSTNKDQVVLHELIKDADIVISNFNDRSATKIKCSYEQLKAINPKLIFAHLTAYGSDDKRPAFDVALQAETGFLFMNGELDGQPVKMPVALIDILAAHQLKEAILIALLHRYKTGKGSYVTTSLLESAIASLANQATNYLMVNHIPQRMGTLHPNIAPYGDIFYTKDEKAIILAVGTERQWNNLCQVLDLESLINDPLYKTNAERVKNRKALADLIRQPIRQLLRSDLITALNNKNVPVGCVNDMQEVFEMPKAQAMILEEDHGNGFVSKRVQTVSFEIASR